MREILFKGLCQYEPVWYFGQALQQEDHSYLILYNELLMDVGDTLSQYTGMTDVEGNKIFENDIVWVSLYNQKSGKFLGNFKGFVVWDEYEWAVEMEDDKFPLASWCLVDKVVVVGNRFNKEDCDEWML